MVMTLARFIALLLLLTWPAAGLAQSYPNYARTTVNDYAEVLSEPQETALIEDLAALRSKTGVEMTVLTLESQAPYAPDESLESFATGLFNAWGIGRSDRNDGVLIMVLIADRAMRIELGAGYARNWDGAAQRVVDDVFLPAFRDGDYAAGIALGTTATIDEIVLPFLEGQAPPSPPSGSSGHFELDPNWIFSGFLGLVLLLAAQRQIGDLLARLRRCPQCALRTLRRSTITKISATTSSSGLGERHTWCTSCDYDHRIQFTIARKRKSSSGGFGGGRSGGGGASGRW